MNCREKVEKLFVYGKIIISLAGCVANIERLTEGQVARAYAGAFCFPCRREGACTAGAAYSVKRGKNTEELNKEEGIA